MLVSTKSIHLSGQSIINDQQVANFNANINVSDNATGTDSVNMFITNRELYNANKAEVRNDLNEFEQLVFSIQDEAKTNNEAGGNNWLE